MLQEKRLFGSYLSRDYVIEDPRIEQMARWCRRYFANRRFEYRGLVNQNITLGYYADIASHFFPGPIVKKLKGQIRRCCMEINFDTLSYLSDMLELSVNESLSFQRREELAADIGKKIKESDHRLFHKIRDLRKKLTIYALTSKWASKLNLAESSDINGTLFEKFLLK